MITRDLTWTINCYEISPRQYCDFADDAGEMAERFLTGLGLSESLIDAMVIRPEYNADMSVDFIVSVPVGADYNELCDYIDGCADELPAWSFEVTKGCIYD